MELLKYFTMAIALILLIISVIGLTVSPAYKERDFVKYELYKRVSIIGIIFAVLLFLSSFVYDLI